MLHSKVVQVLCSHLQHGPPPLTVTRLVHHQQQQQRPRRQQSRYQEHFATLGLGEEASKSSVRQRYIELVKQHHPDTSQDGGELFSRIDHAYKQLMKKFQEDKLRWRSTRFQIWYKDSAIYNYIIERSKWSGSTGYTTTRTR